VYGNIYIDEFEVLGASYLQETSGVGIYWGLYIVATVRWVALQWLHATVPVGDG